MPNSSAAPFATLNVDNCRELVWKRLLVYDASVPLVDLFAVLNFLVMVNNISDLYRHNLFDLKLTASLKGTAVKYLGVPAGLFSRILL